MSTQEIVQMRPTKGSDSQEKSRKNPESITTRALYRIIRAVSTALSLMAARRFLSECKEETLAYMKGVLTGLDIERKD